MEYNIGDKVILPLSWQDSNEYFEIISISGTFLVLRHLSLECRHNIYALPQNFVEEFMFKAKNGD